MRKSYLFCIGIVHISLYGMGNGDYERDLAIQEVIIPYDDPDVHRTWAMVNKAYNKMIEDTYRPDKKCIERLMLERNTPIIPAQTCWNKKFSRCAWVIVEKEFSSSYTQSLELTLVGLNSKRDIIITAGLCGGYECFAIDDQVHPRFDKKGDIFYYGFGYRPTQFLASLVEYSLVFNGKMQIKPCVLGVGKSQIVYLHGIMNFPVLVKAILQSTQVCDISGLREGQFERVHHVDGVIIPDNYKFFKKNSYDYSLLCEYLSYDYLSLQLREVIDQQYKKQQRAKKENK